MFFFLPDDAQVNPLSGHLEARMLDTPALTVVGVLAKVQSWYCDHEIEDIRSGGEPDNALETDLSASIYRDLERLAGEARS